MPKAQTTPDAFCNETQFPPLVSEARRIVTLLSELIELPRSMIDLGGNTGAWCQAFKNAGAQKVLCIDHPRTRQEKLLVDDSEFLACDLSTTLPAPIPCDLAVSLEVLEHVPEPAGEAAVDFLTQSAPMVLFSAAVPGQPGWEHINCKPHAYWKSLFQQRGFERLDIIRPRIIEDATMPFWYRQNLFLFANAAGLGRVRVRQIPFENIPDDFELVHTRLLEEYRKRENTTLGKVFRQLWSSLARSVGYRTGRMKRSTTPCTGKTS